MPSRGNYQVTSQEEGKPRVHEDNSYSSCILTLLIFFFLCLILLLASLPWKGNYTSYSEYENEASRTEQHNSGQRNEKITTTERPVEVITKDQNEVQGTVIFFERYSNNASSTESPNLLDTEANSSGEIETSTQSTTFFTKSATISMENSTISTENARISMENATISVENATISTENATISTENAMISTESAMISTESAMISTESAMISTESVTISTESTEDQDRSINILPETSPTPLVLNSTETYKIPSTEGYTELYKDRSTEVTDNVINTTFTYETEVTIESTTISSTTEEELTASSSLEGRTLRETTSYSPTRIEESTENMNTVSQWYYKNDTTSTRPVTLKIREEEDTTPSETTITSLPTKRELFISEKPFEQICITGECKQIASKMLFYVNHSSDPCEDFYEYACGGFEKNPQIIEKDLEKIAYQRIAKQMQKENHEGKASMFSKYYKSCMDYETMNLTERISLVKAMLKKIGKFYTTANWNENDSTITELLAKLLLHHSPLLFDISPDLDEHSPTSYTLKIGPTDYKNPLETDTVDDPCYDKDPEEEKQFVNLNQRYEEYKRCKNNTTKFISSISKALTVLGVFDELENTYNISQYIQTTVFNIDMEIIQKYFANFPSKSEIREAYLMKSYEYIRVKDWDENAKLVNWTQLIKTLTGKYMLPEAQLQVYFHKNIVRGLKSLEEFKKRDPMQLHNALLGLYARNLYHELVLMNHQNARDHCLRVAANLLIPEAARLYISSFTEDELFNMNRTIHQVFVNLKKTLEIKVAELTWTTEEERQALVKKVDALKLAVPDVSYFQINDSAYNHSTENKFHLSDNYVANTMTLMQRYRTLIYDRLITNPQSSKQIWTHYATPYQSRGLAIYGLNLVVIPFGAIDWSAVFKDSLEYLNLATLGTVIGHQIAHHFDANGISYWNETRNDNNFLANEDGLRNPNFDDYIECQQNFYNQIPMNITLPSTGQTVSYHISQLTLNERLSEAMGLRLAYDTLDRLRSSKESLLPWIVHQTANGIDQLFYLAYAQMHCIKEPLTSSYVSLYEDEQLPSRIRIFFSGSSNQRLGETWSCPIGSGMVPSSTCSVFPYLQLEDITVDSE